VDRHPNGPCLVGQRPGDRLADPPRCVRRELVTLGVVELLHRPDQPKVPLLNKIQEGQSTADVTLRDGDDQAQVRLDQPALGHSAVPRDDPEITAQRRLERRCAGQLLLGEDPGFDAAGEFDLVGRGEKRNPADLAEVLTYQVGGRVAGGELILAEGVLLGRVEFVLRRFDVWERSKWFGECHIGFDDGGRLRMEQHRLTRHRPRLLPNGGTGEPQ
jgi:hypothetical protein